jgi:hypothetical protein
MERTTVTKVPGVADLEPYEFPSVVAQPGCMAQKNNRLLLTTGLARVEGEHVMYTRASNNRPSRRVAPRRSV